MLLPAWSAPVGEHAGRNVLVADVVMSWECGHLTRGVVGWERA